ncbi:2-hydroxyacyl-CoA dehydratase subunit D [Chloroflexota bacterium]
MQGATQMGKLAKINDLYADPWKFGTELKKDGQRIVGYTCTLVPREITAAASFVPFMMRGAIGEPTQTADLHLEPLCCGLCRSIFNLGVEGKYSFLDGIVTCHACNNMDPMHAFWKYYVNPPFVTTINAPHTITEASLDFYTAEMKNYIRLLEEFTNSQISSEAISHYIELYNTQRSLLRQLSSMLREEPPLISGSEMTRIVLASLILPVEQANDLLSGVIEEVKVREDNRPKPGPRLLLWSMYSDNTSLIELIEECGANVVISDSCGGWRHYHRNIPSTSDPIQAIAQYYLENIRCSRLYQEGGTERFQMVKKLADDNGASAIIAYVLRYCDAQETDMPEFTDYFKGKGMPVLWLEDDYSLATREAIRTRIQAFLETADLK